MKLFKKSSEKRDAVPLQVLEVGSKPIPRGIDALVLDESKKTGLDKKKSKSDEVIEKQLRGLLSTLTGEKIGKPGFEGFSFLVDKIMGNATSKDKEDSTKTDGAEESKSSEDKPGDDEAILELLAKLLVANMEHSDTAWDPEIIGEDVVADKIRELLQDRSKEDSNGGTFQLNRNLLFQLLLCSIRTVMKVLDRRAWTLWDLQAVMLILLLTCMPLWFRRLCALGLACYLKASRRPLVFAQPNAIK